MLSDVTAVAERTATDRTELGRRQSRELERRRTHDGSESKAIVKSIIPNRVCRIFA